MLLSPYGPISLAKGPIINGDLFDILSFFVLRSTTLSVTVVYVILPSLSMTRISSESPPPFVLGLTYHRSFFTIRLAASQDRIC